MRLTAFGLASQVQEYIIHGADTKLAFQFGWGVECLYLAIHHNAHSVAILCLVHIVSGYEDGDATVGCLVNEFPKLATSHWIDASCWLIKKHNLGVVEDAEREGELLFPTQRQ